MAYSPNSNDFEDLFGSESICIDEEVSSINPDEFLNLDEFKDNAIKNESSPIYSSMEHQYTHANHSPQQLTPPISPQPSSSIIIDSSIFQKIRLIPITALQQHLPPAKKVKTIVPKPSSSSDSDSNTVATSSIKSNSPVDKALIKQLRQIRNRESAVLSRNKKKEYVQTLEAENADLRKENNVLKAENYHLKERLKHYTTLTCRCANSISTKLPSKNTTFMLAVLFMVGFNVVPFGNLFLKNISQKPIVSQQFNSRHLLFVENSTSRFNATEQEESTVQDDPVYFNQTEHIRKVNIENIRRWIPEPDLFNVSYLKKDFDFNPDPLQEKFTKMYEKSREQSQKHVKNKKRLPKKKPMIGPVQLYNSNMNIIKLNEFFDEINRQDDTFYVFSFKADHLLLPAIDNSYNFSQIKMNLIMPRINGEH